MLLLIHQLQNTFSGYVMISMMGTSPRKNSQEFHHVTTQTHFLSDHARNDIQITVTFITTRVNKSYKDDRGKL